MDFRDFRSVDFHLFYRFFVGGGSGKSLVGGGIRAKLVETLLKRPVDFLPLIGSELRTDFGFVVNLVNIKFFSNFHNKVTSMLHVKFFQPCIRKI